MKSLVGPYTIDTDRDENGRVQTFVRYGKFSASAAAVENGCPLSDGKWNEHEIQEKHLQAVFDRIEQQEKKFDQA